MDKMIKKVLAAAALLAVISFSVNAKDVKNRAAKSLKINATCLNDCFGHLEDEDEFPIIFPSRDREVSTWANIVYRLCAEYNKRHGLVTPLTMVGIDNVEFKYGITNPSLCSSVKTSKLPKHGNFTFKIVQEGLPGHINFSVNTTCLSDVYNRLKNGEAFVFDIPTDSEENEVSWAHVIGKLCDFYNSRFKLVKTEEMIGIDDVLFTVNKKHEKLSSTIKLADLRSQGGISFKVIASKLLKSKVSRKHATVKK